MKMQKGKMTTMKVYATGNEKFRREYPNKSKLWKIKEEQKRQWEEVRWGECQNEKVSKGVKQA